MSSFIWRRFMHNKVDCRQSIGIYKQAVKGRIRVAGDFQCLDAHVTSLQLYLNVIDNDSQLDLSMRLNCPSFYQSILYLDLKLHHTFLALIGLSKIRPGLSINHAFHCASVDALLHDDVIKWKHFPRYWPFVRGIHRSPVNSPHKGQWRGALMFTLICAQINGWVNNREAGDLRR